MRGTSILYPKVPYTRSPGECAQLTGHVKRISLLAARCVCTAFARGLVKGADYFGTALAIAPIAMRNAHTRCRTPPGATALQRCKLQIQHA